MLTPVPRTFLIDTDTASDDAIALIMALRAPDVRVAAITVVAGNVNLQQATRNALYTVELCGAAVPVYSGAEKPLLRAYQDATWFHGRDGLGDHNYPAPRQSPERLHAVDAIIETIEAQSWFGFGHAGSADQYCSGALADALGSRKKSAAAW